MKVDLYGVYRLVAGKKTLEIEITPGLSIRGVLDLVTVQVPELRGELFDRQAQVFSYIPIYLNGRNPRLFEAGFEQAISPNDVVSIFSPISSGKINVEEAGLLDHS